MDFTIKTYRQLLTALQNQGFVFQTFQEFLTVPATKAIILRHDVDKLPQNSLRFAQIQNELGIKGSYFFRIVHQSYDPKIIEKIAGLGHEVGYHYEDVDLAYKLLKKKNISPSQPPTPKGASLPPESFREGNQRASEAKELINKAIQLFEKHLGELRKYYPVKTICMHGSPLSKYDNKLLWKYYNYRDYGIIGEPYFDVDFTKVLYLTDTGRRWNGGKVSIRDRVNIKKEELRADTPLGDGGACKGILNFKKTQDIIYAANKGTLPDQIMFTFHPQRWTDSPLPWVKELVLQNVKNVGKYFLNKLRSK